MVEVMAGKINCVFFETKPIAIGTGIEFVGSPTDRPGIRFGSQPTGSEKAKRH
jgi:hypothetical protein